MTNNLQTRFDTITIDTSEIINGHEYFRETGSWILGTSYFRKTEEGKIYLKDPSDSEALLYDFNANVGDKWISNLYGLDEDWEITLQSKTDTIEYEGCILPNCYRFYVDLLTFIDLEYTIWFAPNIGYVRVWFQGYHENLKEYMVNGVEGKCF